MVISINDLIDKVIKHFDCRGREPRHFCSVGNQAFCYFPDLYNRINFSLAQNNVCKTAFCSRCPFSIDEPKRFVYRINSKIILKEMSNDDDIDGFVYNYLANFICSESRCGSCIFYDAKHKDSCVKHDLSGKEGIEFINNKIEK